jgi:A/G-specific adenine glycosylase
MDTNVERVVARLNGIERPLAEARAACASCLGRNHARRTRRRFRQAMMDLGATICRPRAPDASCCPLQGECIAHASLEPERFPAPKRKAVRSTRYGIAHWTERNGCIWLVRRPAKGMHGGMAALPARNGTDAPKPAGPVPRPGSSRLHSLPAELAVVASDAPAGEGWWHRLEERSTPGFDIVPARVEIRPLVQERTCGLSPFSRTRIDRADQVRVDPTGLPS